MCQFFFFSISFHIASFIYLFFQQTEKGNGIPLSVLDKKCFQGIEQLQQQQQQQQTNNECFVHNKMNRWWFKGCLLSSIPYPSCAQSHSHSHLYSLSLSHYQFPFSLILFTTPQSEFSANQMEHIFKCVFRL